MQQYSSVSQSERGYTFTGVNFGAYSLLILSYLIGYQLLYRSIGGYQEWGAMTIVSQPLLIATTVIPYKLKLMRHFKIIMRSEVASVRGWKIILKSSCHIIRVMLLTQKSFEAIQPGQLSLLTEVRELLEASGVAFLEGRLYSNNVGHQSWHPILQYSDDMITWCLCFLEIYLLGHSYNSMFSI